MLSLSDRERAVVEGLHRQQRVFVPGQGLVHQGRQGQAAYILLSGWTISFKVQSNGSRQIAGVQVPGDFLGLRGLLLGVSDHSIEPVGDIRVAEVVLNDLDEVFASSPRLTMAILQAVSRETAMMVEHLVGLGRRNALERMAHFLLELGTRLTLVNAGDMTGYDCPLTQDQLADTLGLSAVHVNRVLRQLREDGLVTFREGRVAFDDRERLVAYAGFDPAYLDLAGPLPG